MWDRHIDIGGGGWRRKAEGHNFKVNSTTTMAELLRQIQKG